MKIRFFKSLVTIISLSLILSPLVGICQQYGFDASTFNTLTMKEKAREFRAVSEEEKVTLFRALSEEERIMLFRALNEEEKITLFRVLSEEERITLFRALNEEEKITLFKELSEQDQENIRRRLRVDERVLVEEITPAPVTVEEEAIVRPRISPPEERVSTIERILSSEFPTEISPTLRQYGYDFFEKDISTFTPITNVPVGSDYIIGPGDNFKIHLWGKVEAAYDVTVSRDGQITVPRLGTFSVSGLTYAELKDHLTHKFRDYYPEFDMSITMGHLRTIQIFMVGEAENPGTYSVSSLSTLITALFSTGGPGKNGSLRNVRLFRNEKLIRDLDLYDFFLKGDKSQDHRLGPGDTIFIPIIGPVVGISGIVRRPAIYETKGMQTIADVIDLAGGVLPIGYLQNVVVERIERHRRRIIKSFNLDPGNEKARENLQAVMRDGDLVRIYPVHKRIRRVVYLEGHVKYPKEYELKPNMRVSDLIPSYDSLLPEPYLPQAEIIRLIPPDLRPEIVEFNLGGMLAGDKSQDLLLQDLDRVKIYHKWEKKKMPDVAIKGEVRKPGIYCLCEGMTAKDLIFQAGNFTHKAYLEKADLTRIIQTESGTTSMNIEFSPREAMLGKETDNIVLQEDDTIYIREIPEYAKTLEQRVTLEGEFLYPGEYTFRKGDKLASVIEKAGGFTGDAYPLGAIFARESVRKVQAERVKEYITKLEEDILTTTALSTEIAIDREQATILKDALSAKKELLQKLRGAEVTGRMVIDLPEAMACPESEYNIELRPWDRLFVPIRPDSVIVMGEVYNPTSLLLENDKPVSHYIDKVGGMTKKAEGDEAYLVKADGSVFSKRQDSFFGLITWDHANYRWKVGGFNSIKADAGDTIIIPRKVEKYPWLRITKDITQILYQIAVAAGVIVVAY
jgi:protein involved in polysaccharide export with SLBB domain